MAKIWFLSSEGQSVREQRPLSWCIDKLWISPRDYRGPALPRTPQGESVWVEVTEFEVQEAPGYKPGFHWSYLTPQEVEERLKRV